MISAFRQSRQGTRPIKVSFEFFPPKTPEMEATLWSSIERLAPLNPSFVSVTYGAGGSTRERTHNTVARIVRETPLKPAAHLTCVNATTDEVDEVVRSYWDAGVRHIVALRGDPLTGIGTSYQAHRRLGFAREQVAGWLGEAGLDCTLTRDLAPPKGGADQLTVSLWLAEESRSGLDDLAEERAVA